MNGYKILPLCLLLATPFLSITKRPTIDTTQIDTTQSELESGSPKAKPKRQKRTTETTTPEMRELQQIEKQLQQVTQKIRDLHQKNVVYQKVSEDVSIQPDIRSQLQYAQHVLANDQRYASEFKTVEQRHSNYRDVALLVATVNGAAFVVANAGIECIKKVVERIPHLEAVIGTFAIAGFLGALGEDAKRNASHEYVQKAEEALCTNSAHLATLKQAASELAKLEAQQTTLEERLEELKYKSSYKD